MNFGFIVSLYIFIVRQGQSQNINCAPCSCSNEYDGMYLHCNGGGVHEYPKDMTDDDKRSIVRIILTWTSMNTLPHVKAYEYPQLNAFIEVKNRFLLCDSVAQWFYTFEDIDIFDTECLLSRTSSLASTITTEDQVTLDGTTADSSMEKSTYMGSEDGVTNGDESTYKPLAKTTEDSMYTELDSTTYTYNTNNSTNNGVGVLTNTATIVMGSVAISLLMASCGVMLKLKGHKCYNRIKARRSVDSRDTLFIYNDTNSLGIELSDMGHTYPDESRV